MNKQRRKEIENVIARLNDVLVRLNNIHDDEEMAFDNLPDGLQCSLNGENMQEWINLLDNAIDSIEEAIGVLNEGA